MVKTVSAIAYSAIIFFIERLWYSCLLFFFFFPLMINIKPYRKSYEGLFLKW